MDIALLGVIAAGLSITLGAVKLSQELWRAFRRIAGMVDDLTEVKNLVKHHLGPNGDTPPLHKRVEAVENRITMIEARLSALETNYPAR